MRQKLLFLVLGLAISTITLAVGFTIFQISLDGRGTIEGQIMLRQANSNWQAGHFLQAAQSFIKGSWMVVEGNIRWQFAQPFIKQTNTLSQTGKYSEALAACETASRILGRYDTEGVNDYRCYMIQTRIYNPQLFNLTPTAQP